MTTQAAIFAAPDIEKSVLASILIDPDVAAELIDELTPGDFFADRNRAAFEAMVKLWHNGEPLDTVGLTDEGVEPSYIADIGTAYDGWRGGRHSAERLRHYTWMRNFVALSQKIISTDAPVDELFAMAQEQLTAITPPSRGDALLRWEESFPHYDAVLEERRNAPDNGGWPWPWASWNNLLGQLRPGLLAMLAAGDGMGKTTYLEAIAEQWAKSGRRVVFAHFELSRPVMEDRRMVRHSGIDMQTLQSGALDGAQVIAKQEADARLQSWAGNVHYLKTEGWSMRQLVREVEHLASRGDCEALIVDYLDKCSPTNRQVRLYGTNTWQRQADDVEVLKTCAERLGIRVICATQMNKQAKSAAAGTHDRTGMRGSGEKSEKSNVVILLQRERLEDDDSGLYSPLVDVTVDKNTLGPTGKFRQMMRPGRFAVADVTRTELKIEAPE